MAAPERVEPDILRFEHTPDEAFNLTARPLLPERLLEYTEFEFRQYTQHQGYTDLEFGRILVGGRYHVLARYNMGKGAWSKKYMIVFAGIEYAITATCFDQLKLAEKESNWDAIVKSFRLRKWSERNDAEIKARRSEVAGELFARAYEASSNGRYPEACTLLEQCLTDNPNHILAHKELAFVLKITGDAKGALPHRREVKRLDPSDSVNRFNLAGILYILDDRDEALREVEELIMMDPSNPRFLELRKVIKGGSLTYSQHYDEEFQQHPGKLHPMKLIGSIIPDFKEITFLILRYQWEENLSEEETSNVTLRAIAYICCAIYDVAVSAGVSCLPSPLPNGRRPAWILEGEKSPVSLTLSDIDTTERTCQMTIGAVLMAVGEPQGNRTLWEKIHTGFKTKFSNITI